MDRLTESFLHLKGYVQGMSDLCAPIYVVMSGDENMTFWCFVEVMDRMVSACGFHENVFMDLTFFQKQNFLRDQSGMKKQLSTLQQLIEVMDPELFRHLGIFHSRDRCRILTCTFTPEKTDALNLFFCFRYVLRLWNMHSIHQTLDYSWVLIAFKREFPFEDVLRLWEVLWTDYYTSDLVLFVALAVLESHRDMILRYLVEVGFNFTSSIYPNSLP